MGTRVLLIDAHNLVRRGLSLLLEQEPDLEVVGEFEDAAAAIDAARDLSPDVIVMHLSMPEDDGAEATRRILAATSGARIVALSDRSDRRFVEDVLHAGARGYVLEQSAPEDFVEAVRAVSRDEVYVSRELPAQVLAPKPPASLVTRTKLHRPPLPPDLVARIRLLAPWKELRTRCLTLVSSPAGYGKSTLASQWLQSGGDPHAWLSLDEQDNDLRTFVSGLVAAIRLTFPGTCGETGSMLGAAALPPPTVLGRVLLNDLDAIDTRFVLVLDDYHRITSARVHDLMAEVLDHPPGNMHLIILTRRDPPLPIETLRGRGQANVLGLAETRFSIEETGLFLEQVLDGPVDDATVRTVHEKLEGWPAGMRLLARSVRTRPEMDALLSGLEGGFTTLLDYLMDEVLAHQPGAMADLMIETSVLDRFCAPLCDALRGPARERAVNGEWFLERLREENLFLVPLDAGNRWFRFHHLFQDLLRTQLTRRRTEEEIAGLHACACRWFAENGHTDEAIRHGLLSGEVDRATRLVEENRHALLDDDRWFELEKWLARFPEEAVAGRPELSLARLWTLYHHFDWPTIAGSLDAVEALIEADRGGDALRAEVEFFRGYLAYFANDAARSLEHLLRALDLAPANHHEVRAQSELLLGLARQLGGEEASALHRLGEAIYGGDSPRGGARTRLLVAPAYIHLISGRLPEARAANHELSQYATHGGFAYAEVWSRYLRGLVHLWGNAPAEAAEHLAHAAEAKYVLHTRAAVDALTGLALARESLGRTDLADAAIAELTDFVAALEDPAYARIAQSGRTRLALRRGDVAAARAMLEDGPPPVENTVWWFEIPAVTHCRALIADGSRECLLAAGDRLEELLRLDRANHNVLHQVEILTLLAVARGAGRFEKGAAWAAEAAELAAPGGVWHPFQEAGPVLEDLLRHHLEGDPDAPSAREALARIVSRRPRTTGPLTAREAEILGLVAEGLANREIAARIKRTAETVKKHLSNVYQKLEVDGRITALTRARELGILPGEER